MEYIRLNKKFLEEVENGTSWEDLLPILAEMKSIAVWLQHVPTVTELSPSAVVPDLTPSTTVDMVPPAVENTPLAATDLEEEPA